ncbi:putative General secretion pathway protein K, GspK [Bosea sp. LC85]|nr:putative General secretion pathway protein K, GspK [Bosea sp. LC85]
MRARPGRYPHSRPAGDPRAVDRAESRRDSGFALLVVIWATGILGLLFMTYIAAARYRAIEAASLSQHARAEAMANIGIKIAILDLLSGSSQGRARSGRFGADGTQVGCTLGDGWTVAISVADEGGKVDLNTANMELVDALIRGVSADGEAAALIVRNIKGLRELSQDTGSTASGGSSSVRALKSVFELDQIPGVGRDLFRALLPLVTVNSGSTGFDPAVAPQQLLVALAPGGAALSREVARRDLPALYITETAGRAFLIGSEALAGTGVRFARDAVVEISQDLPTGYRIREWREGLPRSDADAGGRLPPC